MKKKNTESQPVTRKKKSRFIRKWNYFFNRFFFFVTKDMWHIREHEVKGIHRIYLNALKSIYMAIKGFVAENLTQKASALTYSTVLSIVPLLAVLLGIAKGFGIQDIFFKTLLDYFPSHREELNHSFDFVDNYLDQVRSGIFLGFGLILLCYTVFNLLSTIEGAFNEIWEKPQSRPLKAKIMSYFAMLFLLPIIITVSSGLTLAMSTIKNSFVKDYVIIGPIAELILHLIPFILIVFTFVGMFMAMPNVKVRFFPALLSGILAGVAFQTFQMMYINGMMWISKYNSIYGSFAAFPLLLLWIQLTWVIILFCAKLCYAIQNVDKFYYEKEATLVSRRYNDFLTILVAGHIVHRFIDISNLTPHTAESIADTCKIPIRLTMIIIRELIELGIIIEVNYPEDLKTGYYYPAIDPDKITVGFIIRLLDAKGSENFKVDRQRFATEWELILATRSGLKDTTAETLLKDLPLGN
ncbi:YihY/virulence factor BrkB family protein [Porphyromonas circumdentaria]|uniref:Membrane protein n=1 Tax=Porphyromonas circumdentaria TaxID=29524 RepID=A0A1T4PIT6_9PORP|nr:YihY/virulence factor BrkB family protein [Porphyromonas circumdentaria]MBB6276394.1 membrane protein [Porphyromonas circumdentaria]MDO4722525.1 YihY/virulence factor BrkB family protein [Porphyromonas circumdentaria]SJZ91453.1 membrane protein [Porphyromonas circumdentaria]